ncbi:hypothetical protein BLNAU_21563 [Blattamonas nauphoetae]|uniref:Uncharacterized protein n=1 Tax=Blattamonas nauphoetae TaxID=2049346 RepID=A0ABQ9WZS2_9EUKA|nr:hypothetical protein BLNAU_21563 [Blattamonas nauphoetae]
MREEHATTLNAINSNDEAYFEQYDGFVIPFNLERAAPGLFHMMREVAKRIDHAAGSDSSAWVDLLPPADQWRPARQVSPSDGYPMNGMAQDQETMSEDTRSVTPALFQDTAQQPQPWEGLNVNPSVARFGGFFVENQAERAEDLKDTGRLLPHFEWEDEEVDELKTKMGQAPADIKMYPDANSRRPWNRDYLGNLNKSLYSLETESFHLFKLEDLARGVELMTLKSAELVKRAIDARIEHILKIPIDGVGSTSRMESLAKQNERIDVAMAEAQKRRANSPHNHRQGQPPMQQRRTQTPPRQDRQPSYRKGNQKY